LLVRHQKDTPWVLPGGHLKQNENPSRALRREIKEELGIGIEILGIRNRTNDDMVMMLPLPVSMQELEYYDEEKDELIRKCEFRYFVRANSSDIQADEKEVKESRRFSISELLALISPREVYQSMKDVLEQNEDLLELL